MTTSRENGALHWSAFSLFSGHVSFRVVVCLIGIMVGGQLAGCSPTISAPTATAISEPPLASVLPITHPDQVVRPIDNYLPGEEQIIGLTTAYFDLVNQCLHAHGVTGTAAAFTDPAALPLNVHVNVRERVMLTTLYGDFDPDNAKSRGYALGDDRPANLWGSMPPDAGAVGTACLMAVDSVSPGEGSVATGWVGQQQLPDGGPVVNRNDSRYVPILAQWSGCMHDKGFDYPDPRAAFFDDQWTVNRRNGLGVTPQEIATAVADMDCKISTNLVGWAVAVQSAYDQVYIDSHPDALAAWRTQLSDYLAGKAVVPDIEPFMSTGPASSPT